MKKLLPTHELFVFDFKANIYLENFIISAVASILLVRMFLGLTGYPQIGGESLHVAHMLWGGLLMMLALGLTLSFLNKEAKATASIIGGVGFGLFIDELGKFLTHDNNYFFEPTFALLYIIFLVLILGSKKLSSLMQKDEKEYAINAIELLKDAVFYDLDNTEKNHVLKYLNKADKKNQVVIDLIELVSKAQAIPRRKQGWITKFKHSLHKRYIKIIESTRFLIFLLVIFVVGSFSGVLSAVRTFYFFNAMNFWDWGLNISIIGSAVFLLIGFKNYPRNKNASLVNFKRAAMISVLFTQFFTFYHQQLAALIPLLTSYTTYLGLQALLETKHSIS